MLGQLVQGRGKNDGIERASHGNLGQGGVALQEHQHIAVKCGLGEVLIECQERIVGSFVVELLLVVLFVVVVVVVAAMLWWLLLLRIAAVTVTVTSVD